MSNCSLTFSPPPATHFAPVSRFHQPCQKPNTLPPTTLSPPSVPVFCLFHLPLLQILPAAHPSSPSTSHLDYHNCIQLPLPSSPISCWLSIWQPVWSFKSVNTGTSLVAQWLRLHTPKAGSKSSTPDQETKIPYAAQYSRTKPKQQ